MTTTEDVDEEVGTLTAADAQRLAEEAAEKAKLAERARCAAIDELVEGTGVPAKTIAKMKTDGLSVGEVAVEIVKLGKAGRIAALERLEADSPDLSADEGDEGEFTEDADDEAADGEKPKQSKTKKLAAKKHEAMKLGEAKFKAEWAADFEKCQEQFSGEETYVAYREFENKEELAELEQTEWRV